MSNINNKINHLNRRDFLKKLGLGASASGLALAGCDKASKKLTEETVALGEIPTDKMTYRVNPNTGDKVSILGYGCMRWPTIEKDGDQVIDQEQVNRLVDTAMAHGVNYYDTSPAYCRGKSEAATGIALKRHPRDKYFIATKLSNFAKHTWSEEESKKIYHNSFKELQTDYIDYMLLHAIGGGSGLEEFNARYVDNGILDFLMAEREAGRIRNLGFSFHGNIDVFDWALANHDKYKWDFVQIQYNYLDWRHGKEPDKYAQDGEYLYDELQKRGIPAIIMEPLLGGRLSKVPDHVAQRLKEAEPESSVASWAFRFAGSPEGVLTVLSGMTYMEHLEDNLRTYCPLKPLSDDEKQFLYDTAGIIRQYPTVACNECQYCMPCPYGIDIPTIFSHYNKCVNEGNVAEGPDAANYAKARRAYLVSYDRNVEKLRQANHCIGCNQCSPHCPQKINIPRQLQRIDRYVENLRKEEPVKQNA